MISTNSSLRFLCLKKLNQDLNDCADFESRYCCPIATFNTSSYPINSTIDERKRSKRSLGIEPTIPQNLPAVLDDLRKFK